MRNRAFRFHEVKKSKTKARKIVCESWGQTPTDRKIGLVAQTPHPCSCYSCGNPRKWFKEKTMQEKKLDIYDKE